MKNLNSFIVEKKQDQANKHLVMGQVYEQLENKALATNNYKEALALDFGL